MSQDPAAVHRALLAGSSGPPRRRPASAGTAAVLAAAGMVVVGASADRPAAWAVLGVVGALATVLLGLAHLPAGVEASGQGPTGPVAPAARMLERVGLLAAATGVAGALLAGAVPALAGRALPVALAALAVVVLAAPALTTRVPRRAELALGWAGAAATALLLLSVPGSRTGTATLLPGGTAADVLTVGLAVALSGVALQPAVVARRGRSRGVAAGAAAGVAAVVLLGAATGPAEALFSSPGGPAVRVVAAVVAAVALLAAAAGATTGVRPPTGPFAVPAPRRRTALLALAAAVAVAAADPVRLVSGYAVVVLTLAVLALLAGRSEWRRRHAESYQPAARRRSRRGAAVTGVATVLAGGMLLLAAVWGWPAVLALALVSAMMGSVSRHDRDLRARLAVTGAEGERVLPTVVRAFVVAPELDRPALRAVTVARALRATSVEVLTVAADEGAAASLRRQWEALDLPVALVELAAPPGRGAEAVVAHVAAARRAEPDGLAVVYLPAVTGAVRWYRRLAGSPAHRLRRRLAELPGTVVTDVPWKIEES